ncbi:hypothetical protein, partial [Phocaeicola sartorii]|uniref:hypothetical protein n=1 Tax=Phocaeicola sartorii TaxID=671267 RepID=UPI0025A94FEF
IRSQKAIICEYQIHAAICHTYVSARLVQGKVHNARFKGHVDSVQREYLLEIPLTDGFWCTHRSSFALFSIARGPPVFDHECNAHGNCLFDLNARQFRIKYPLKFFLE